MLNIKYCNVPGSCVASQCVIERKQRTYDDHAKLTFTDIFLAAADGWQNCHRLYDKIDDSLAFQNNKIKQKMACDVSHNQIFNRPEIALESFNIALSLHPVTRGFSRPSAYFFTPLMFQPQVRWNESLCQMFGSSLLKMWLCSCFKGPSVTERMSKRRLSRF